MGFHQDAVSFSLMLTSITKGFLEHGADAKSSLTEEFVVDLFPFIKQPVHNTLLTTICVTVSASVHVLIDAMLRPLGISSHLQQLLDAQGAEPTLDVQEARCWFGTADEWPRTGTEMAHVRREVSTFGLHTHLLTRLCPP